ncbi:MAG TPA: 1-deoxy-D-xylulose-5-phosphate reductoisomerase [Anaerovoracaceae bacterium]|nr:1-deoxy-D-xylulose-5-phosphate reductoisomerase [Anaerovoracaceae bacterium]
MKEIIILGSTGSIGTQALEIIKDNSDKFRVLGLSCRNSIELIEKQIAEYKPKFVCVNKDVDAIELKEKFPKVEFFCGEKGLCDIAKIKCDLILNSLMGISGLSPTYFAIKNGTDIALANKETMVTGGKLIIDLAKEKGAKLLPVDSEHSAIFQCLMGNSKKSIKKLIITASGGPFRGMSLNELKNVTLKQALNHPNWNMGKKITIDSATMMNKGLEVIEARWLFDVPYNRIDAVVHPESIIHSMVEFEDTSVIAQLGIPDMKIPIGMAFNYPNRLKYDCKSLDLLNEGSSLNFEKPDMEVFNCLKLAYDALREGNGATVVLNGANEILVDAFLSNKIGFIDIQNNLYKMMSMGLNGKIKTIDEILELDKEARRKTIELIN